MKLKALILLGLFSFFPSLIQAQAGDSSIFIPQFTFSYGFQIPGGDLADRFGNNSDVALDFHLQTPKLWRWGGRISYLFGDDIRENGILDSISTASGAIINASGQFANVRLFERGMTWMLTMGHLFPIWGPNVNSGIYADLSLGGIWHKIRIEDLGNLSYPLSEEYKKGYDRLTSGSLIRESIGYSFLGNKKGINFFLCLEACQAITSSRRSYNYDTMEADVSQRLDLLFGIRTGWILPLYKRTAKEIYYH